MFYPEFTVPAWSYFIPFLVMVGVLYALGAEYLEVNLNILFPFSSGSSALAQEEAFRLQEMVARLRWLWAEKEKVKAGVSND